MKKALIIIGLVLIALLLGGLTIKSYREVRVYLVLKQADSISFYIPKYGNPPIRSQRLTFREKAEVKNKAWKLSRSAFFPSEVMACGYDAIVDVHHPKGVERIHINRECGYLSSDGILGKWKSYNADLEADFENAKRRGVDDSLLVSP